MSLQIPILGDLTGLQQALRNVPGLVNSAVGQANAAGSRALGGMFSGLRGAVTGFGGLLKNSLVNAVGAVGIVQTFRSTVQDLDRVAKLSLRFGVDPQVLQRLGGAAQLSGGSIEDVAAAIQKVSKASVEAQQGTKSFQDSFAGIGISVDQLRGLKPDELFLLVADNISQLSSETEQAAASIELFGKSSGNIVPFIQLGRDGILELADGIAVASRESFKAAEQISDSFDTLSQNLRSSVGDALNILNPFIQTVLKLATISITGLGVLGSGFLRTLGLNSTEDLAKAIERNQQAFDLLANPEKTVAPEVRSSGPVRTRSLSPSSPPSPQDQKLEQIRQNITGILEGGRGIQRGEIIADSLARIGGGGSSVIVGASDREQQRLLFEQLKALQKIEKNTAATEVARLK